MKFIHLTDTHVVGGGAMLAGLDPVVRLRGAVASINAEHGDADFVIVTGDLTDTGEAGAYEAFLSEIAALSMPVHLMVGNHDDTGVLAATYPSLMRDGAGFAQGAFETDQGRVLMLDTRVPGSDAGAYCEARRAWLQEKLTRDDAPLFLFMHHPPMKIGIASMDGIMLAEAEAFFDLLAPHVGRIRHLFFGHVHRPVWGTWRGIPFSAMRGLNHQVALVLDGPVDEFTGNAEPPAYGVVLVSGDQVTVHMHDYTSGEAGFDLP